MGEGNWRGTEVNGDQSETCSIRLDQAEPRKLEVPNLETGIRGEVSKLVFGNFILSSILEAGKRESI